MSRFDCIWFMRIKFIHSWIQQNQYKDTKTWLNKNYRLNNMYSYINLLVRYFQMISKKIMLDSKRGRHRTVWTRDWWRTICKDISGAKKQIHNCRTAVLSNNQICHKHVLSFIYRSWKYLQDHKNQASFSVKQWHLEVTTTIFVNLRM